MVRIWLLGFGLPLAFAFSGLSQSEDLKQSIDQIRKAAQDAEAPKDAQKSQQRERFRALLDQLPEALSSGSPMMAENVAQQLALLTDTDAIRAQCLQIAATLREKRKAAEAKTLAEIDAALKSAGEAVRTASKPEEIDPALNALSALQNNRNAMDNSMVFEQRRQQIDAGLQFLRLWQDYLANKAAGDLQNAWENLSNLTQQDRYSLNWVPRSELLKLRQALRKSSSSENSENENASSIDQQEAALLARVKAPEDLAGAIADLKALLDANRRSNTSDVESHLQALQSLQRSYQDFQAGLATQIDLIVPTPGYPSAPNPVPEVRTQILLLVLPRYLGLPAGQKALAGENPATFLDRVESEAAARGDYQIAAKAADAKSLTRGGARAVTNNTQAGLFVIGQNQEAAGQVSLAVASYEKALALPVRIVPPQVIGKRLEEISKKYPDDFQKGVDLYLAPPLVDPVTRDMAMRENMMRAQMMSMRGPQSQTRPPAPVLSIPAVASRPVSSPPPAATPAAKTP